MNKVIENLTLGIAAAVIFAILPAAAFTQDKWSPSPKPEPTIAQPKPERPVRSVMEPPMPSRYFGGDTSEKSIAVDSGVNLSLCVTQGTVKVNGWNRSEVRVFVQDGSKFGFKVQLKSPKTGAPALMMVTGIETKNKYASPTPCIWGGEIEIDVPVNATVTIKGQEITTKIDTVKRVEVKTVGGDISLRNIANGITAYSNQGDITVDESAGPMILDTTTGNILVFEAAPSEIGDMFKAKTNSGEISLQRLGYRQMEVGSISGSVAFNGEILSGGSYSMSTSKGSIRLAIPQTTSCVVTASYGYGSFNPELPFKILTENKSEGPIKTIVGELGKGGDATIKLSTNNGSIGIKKQ